MEYLIVLCIAVIVMYLYKAIIRPLTSIGRQESSFEEQVKIRSKSFDRPYTVIGSDAQKAKRRKK